VPLFSFFDSPSPNPSLHGILRADREIHIECPGGKNDRADGPGCLELAEGLEKRPVQNF